MKCPECDSKLIKLKGKNRHECRNKMCPIIEVRKGRKGLQVLYDSTLIHGKKPKMRDLKRESSKTGDQTR